MSEHLTDFIDLRREMCGYIGVFRRQLRRDGDLDAQSRECLARMSLVWEAMLQGLDDEGGRRAVGGLLGQVRRGLRDPAPLHEDDQDQLLRALDCIEMLFQRIEPVFVEPGA